MLRQLGRAVPGDVAVVGLYRLEPARLRPFQDWLAKYEQAWNSRLDRVDDYLQELQQKGSSSD
jgi:hypothetical protein